MTVRSRLVAGLCLVASTAFADERESVSPHVKTVSVKDDAWGITAFTMQIPDNWSFEGALLRDPYCGGVPTVAYRIASPDGLAGVQVMPSFVWHWADDPHELAIYRKFHCKTMEAMTPTEFLGYLAPLVRPEPKVGPIEPTADAAQLQQMIAQYNDRSRAAHLPGVESGGGVRSRLEYTFHGHLIEENLRVTVQTFKTPSGRYGGPAHLSWSSTADVIGSRAPKGQLEAVMQSVAPLVAKASYTAEWLQRQQHRMASDARRASEMIRQQGAATTAMLKRSHEAYMKASKERFDRSQKIDREREAARHNGAVAWTLYAGDEQLQRNPATGQVVRVTNQHGTNAHQDTTSGDIVISEDPSYDPSYYVRGTWTQLEPVDPFKP